MRLYKVGGDGLQSVEEKVEYRAQHSISGCYDQCFVSMPRYDALLLHVLVD
jgi:hypothetical protein